MVEGAIAFLSVPIKGEGDRSHRPSGISAARTRSPIRYDLHSTCPGASAETVRGSSSESLRGDNVGAWYRGKWRWRAPWMSDDRRRGRLTTV
jgi:hypothetical protein